MFLFRNENCISQFFISTQKTLHPENAAHVHYPFKNELNEITLEKSCNETLKNVFIKIPILKLNRVADFISHFRFCISTMKINCPKYVWLGDNEYITQCRQLPKAVHIIRIHVCKYVSILLSSFIWIRSSIPWSLQTRLITLCALICISNSSTQL